MGDIKDPRIRVVPRDDYNVLAFGCLGYDADVSSVKIWHSHNYHSHKRSLNSREHLRQYTPDFKFKCPVLDYG
jgi:hypothetical protein